MANYQFRKVKLIDPEDIAYRNFCGRCALEKQTLKPKLPPTAINRLTLTFERVMQNLLAEYFCLSPQRILSFEERSTQFGYTKKYREIDAISLKKSQPDILFEIKTSSNINPQTVVKKAKKQLAKSQRIANSCWSNLKLCIIYIDIFPERQLDISDLSLANVSFDRTLESLNKNLDRATSGVMFSGEAVWQRAIALCLIDDPGLWNKAQVEIAENIERRRQKEALIARGIPVKEFPSFLQAHPTPPPEILQFGEFKGKTVLGSALLNALRK